MPPPWTLRSKVEEIVVFADMNPIPRILNYRPASAKPVIGLRLKLQQATPIRAAASTGDGVWHVGGVFVDAAGGGCTSPALAHGDPQWERHLGEVQARAWGQAADGAVRVRFRVRHPMDTGLAPGIPAFYLENLAIHDGQGRELGRIDTFEPVSENPVFTLEVSPLARIQDASADRARQQRHADPWPTSPCPGGRARCHEACRNARICLLWALPGWAAGLTYRLEPRLIAPDTYVFEGAVEHFTTQNGGNILNTGFIVTDDGVIVIQTGPSRRYGEEMQGRHREGDGQADPEGLRQQPAPGLFPGFAGFRRCPDRGAAGNDRRHPRRGARGDGEHVPAWSGDWMRGTDAVVPAEPVFAATQVYGGHRLRLIPLSGHTQADLAIYDETTRVLFAGGLVFSDRAPTTPHADIPRWLDALDELAALDVAVLVPNHGTIRPDNSAIAQTRDYLNWLTAALGRAADGGLDMTEVMALDTPARFAPLAVLREEFIRSRCSSLSKNRTVCLV